MFYPCLVYPSDNVWRSRRADAPRCSFFFYWFHIFLDHTTNISIKVRAPRRVSAPGAPNDFPNCHLDKTTMDNSSMHRHFLFLFNLSRRRKWFGEPSIEKDCNYILIDAHEMALWGGELSTYFSYQNFPIFCPSKTTEAFFHPRLRKIFRQRCRKVFSVIGRGKIWRKGYFFQWFFYIVNNLHRDG